jgi:hypothetical protein
MRNSPDRFLHNGYRQAGTEVQQRMDNEKNSVPAWCMRSRSRTGGSPPKEHRPLLVLHLFSAASWEETGLRRIKDTFQDTNQVPFNMI